MHLRQVLMSLNVIATPQPQVYISLADDAFKPDDSLKDPKTFEQLKKLVANTLFLAQKLKT